MRALRVLLLLAACGGSSSPLDRWDAGRQVGFADPGGGFAPPSVLGQGASQLAGNGLQVVSRKLAIDPTITQQRVTGTCGAGNSVQSINQAGTVNCVAAGTGTVTNVTGGTGVTITNPSTTPNVAIDSATWQSRVTGTAGTHAAITAIAAAGTVTTATFFDATSFPTQSCTANTAVKAINADGTSTCGDITQNDYTSTTLEWKDDWMEWFASTGTQGYSHEPYQLANVGTSAGWQDVAAVTGRPGILEMISGTTATGKLAAHTSANAINFGDGSWSFRWVGGVSALSTSAQEYAALAGFYDTDTAVNQVDGCYFLYDRGNVATSGPNATNLSKLSCWCASNSARTTFLMDGSTTSNESFVTHDAPVAAVAYPNTNILNLEVRMTGTTRAEFFVNGTKSCDINTNIPSGSARLTGAGFMGLKSVGTTSVNMLDTDYTDLKLTGLTARSP